MQTLLGYEDGHKLLRSVEPDKHALLYNRANFSLIKANYVTTLVGQINNKK